MNACYVRCGRSWMKWMAILPLILMIPFMSKAQIKTEDNLNSKYREVIMKHLREDMAKRQASMEKKAEAMLLSLPNDRKLYDESRVMIKTDLVPGTREDGLSELNYTFEISYNCRHIEATTDDYKRGKYRYTQSNSCRAICEITKSIIEEECADLFAPGRYVTTEIYSTTDAMEISLIPYLGEYGDFRYVSTRYNGEPVRISVSADKGITTNAQLAFVRAQSVRNFLENKVPKMKDTYNEFEYITESYADTGSFLRRSSIKITIHDAFREEIVAMNKKLTNDGYIDFNIPTVEDAENTNTYVMIITNEKYDNALPDVPYAHHDGDVFMQYCTKTLGIPERHIKHLKDANKDSIKTQGVNWMKDISVANKGDVRFLMYFAGHGIIDAEGKPYLLINEMDVSKIKKLFYDEKLDEIVHLGKRDHKRLLQEALSIDTLCGYFARVAYKDMTLILDASFNGYQRNGEQMLELPKGADKKKGLRLRGNMVVFAASKFDKTAYSYDKQEHGFFTYFLIRELRKNKGDITYYDLFDNVSKKLSYESSLQGKLQEPFMVIGGKAKDIWEQRTFR